MKKLRITHSKGRGNELPRYLVRCGCCKERLEVFYDDDLLEIGGVMATKEEWSNFFLKVLFTPDKNSLTIDFSRDNPEVAHQVYVTTT